MEGSPTPTRDKKKRGRDLENNAAAGGLLGEQEQHQSPQPSPYQEKSGRQRSRKSRAWGKGGPDKSDQEVQYEEDVDAVVGDAVAATVAIIPVVA